MKMMLDGKPVAEFPIVALEQVSQARYFRPRMIRSACCLSDERLINARHSRHPQDALA